MTTRASRGGVLDASALLAYLQREPGYEEVRRVLDASAAISTVNLAEVYSKVAAAGRQIEAVAIRLPALRLRPEPFTEADARTSGALYPATRPLGLSLRDRACLALGLRLHLPVLTADRAWSSLRVGVEIRSIR